MPDPSPTVFTLETNSAWIVVLAVSFVTLIAAIIARRLIARPGGFSSGLLLCIPLLLPLVAAVVYQQAILPEIAVLKPAESALRARPDELLHFLFLSPDGRTWIPYVFEGAPGIWVFLFGAGISSFMLIRRMAGAVILRRLLARCEIADGRTCRRVSSLVASLSDDVGLPRTPQILLLPEGLSGAFAVGARRGKILISADLVDELDDHELAAVLAHEVAHLQARDVPVVLGAGFLRDFMAWNPFAHLALRRLIQDREFEADRRAAGLTGDPLALASGLLKVFQMTRGQRNFTQRGALALIKPRARVTKRVRHLLALADGSVAQRPHNGAVYAAAGCLVILLGFQAGARIATQDSALAFVVGAPDAAVTSELAASEAEVQQQLSKRERRKQKRAELSGGRLEGLLKTPALRSRLSENMGRLSNRLYKLAHKLGVPVSEFQLRARPLPLFGRSGLGVYRIDQRVLGPRSPR